MDKRMTYEALMVNKARKRGPKYPTATKPCQEPRAKKMHQSTAECGSETVTTSGHHSPTVVTTTGRGGYHDHGIPIFPRVL